MLIIGYTHGIRSERRLCEEVHLNLAYRWFCRLDLTDRIPDHSTFSKNRHGRFRDSDLLRKAFEEVVAYGRGLARKTTKTAIRLRKGLFNNIRVDLQETVVEIWAQPLHAGQGIADRLRELGLAGDLRKLGMQPDLQVVEDWFRAASYLIES